MSEQQVGIRFSCYRSRRLWMDQLRRRSPLQWKHQCWSFLKRHAALGFTVTFDLWGSMNRKKFCVVGIIAQRWAMAMSRMSASVGSESAALGVMNAIDCCRNDAGGAYVWARTRKWQSISRGRDEEVGSAKEKRVNFPGSRQSRTQATRSRTWYRTPTALPSRSDCVGIFYHC